MGSDDVTLRASRAITALLEEGVLARLTPGDDDARLFMDCDLCSFIENRFHEVLDPRSLGGDTRARWLERALGESDHLQDPRASEGEEPLWITIDGERVGTIALGAPLGGTMVRLSSLYVFPSFRRRGIAKRTLERIYAAALATTMSGVRLSTHWAWQHTLQFYVGIGMWAWSFKQSIELAWSKHLPPHVITIDGDRASFAIVRDGDTVPLLEAKRHPKNLEWRETAAMTALERGDRSTLALHAGATLALALALEGWPLVRSQTEWERSPGWDLGGPEVLAYKLACFEQWDRFYGFDVRTPRIPGLPYDEIHRLFADEDVTPKE